MNADQYAAQYINENNVPIASDSSKYRALVNVIAAAIAAERKACLWHEEQAIKFYSERIEWCDSRLGHESMKVMAQYAMDSHIGVSAAIARGSTKSFVELPTMNRIQRKRSKGWRAPEGAVYVGRPSKWQNPIKVRRAGGVWVVVRGTTILATRPSKRLAAEQAVNCFRDYLAAMSPSELEELVAPLRGKNVMCWCSLSEPCHGDVWLEHARLT